MSASPRKIISSQENASPNRGGAPEPQLVPPQPPRSAFMCFTDAKKKELLGSFNNPKDKEEILNTVATEWRLLSDRDRAYWDEVARNDKVRFVREKSEYKGPWLVPKRRAKKHPLAPKRPMSAFLKYSQKRRSMVKEKNPDMSNTDVSRLLGEMWRSASPSERAPYVEQEEVERAKYKDEIKNWRDEQAKIDAASRTSHHSVHHAVEKPQLKQSLDYDHVSFLESSTAGHAHLPVPAGDSSVDRRIFRSYSGGGHPEENKLYKADHRRAFRPSYSHAEIAHSHPVQGKSDQHMFRPHKQVKARSYKPEPMDGTPSMLQPSHPPRHHPHAYRSPYPQQGENNQLAPLNNTGSDISQFDSYYDPEPPFNPRQQRPSSSHYFPDNFYQYP